MKFNSGDRIRVKENGIKGQILAVASSNTMYWYVDYTYSVLWEHSPNIGTYMASQVDDLWDMIGKIADEVNTSLPEGSQVKKTDCQGYCTWLPYTGLRETFDYCKYCGRKRPE